MRKCGSCGETGHNSRTCSRQNRPENEFKKQVKGRLHELNSEPPDDVGTSNLRNRDYLKAPLKEILNELKELIKLEEISKPNRDQLVKLDDLIKKSNPNKSLVYELKRELDPDDKTYERFTLKKKLNPENFSIFTEKTTTDLVQLAIKNGVL